MKPSTLVGIVVAGLVVVAGLISPLFRSSERVAAEAARRQAELARRELVRYDTNLVELTRQRDAVALERADFSKIAGEAQVGLKTLQQDVQEALRRARSADERKGLEPTAELKGVGVDAAGLQSAVRVFDALVKANQGLLESARKSAQNASQAEGAGVPGVSDVAGMVEYVRAGEKLAAANAVRNEVEGALARLLAVGAEWRLAQAAVDHYSGFDVRKIRGDLERDAAELAARLEEARAVLAALEQQVQEREQRLAAVRGELSAARDGAVRHEARGFPAGDDAAFEAYRRQATELAQRMTSLEEEEQVLSQGGVRGAQIDGDDYLSGALRGEDRVIGLTELQRQLAAARERASRLGRGREKLATQGSAVESAGKDAADQVGRFTSRLTELRGQMDALHGEIAKKAEEAAALEGEALQSAQTATRAFQAAGRAIDQRIATARQTQQESDPDRKNQRLKLLIEDAYGGQIGPSAQAAALVLAGRIHHQRMTGIAAQIDALGRFAELVPGSTIDVETLRTRLGEARDAAIKSFSDARDIHEKHARGGGAAWVHQAALAGVHYALAKVDISREKEHLAAALEAVNKAVEKREQSPYLQSTVRLRDRIQAVAAAAGVTTAAPAPAEGETPAEGGDAATEPGGG